MALNCGIVGLPNVGKSTIFSALSSAPAEAANYPFCTIEPNVGIVNVPDVRLQKIASFIPPEKLIPTVVEFVDIAGLVKGASQGEGLGNQFLGHIRQVDAIAHVVRCFENDDIVHVNGKIDPIGDIEIIEMELAIADADAVKKRLENMSKILKSHNKDIVKKAKTSIPILEKLLIHLEDGKCARTLGLSEEDKEIISDLNLLTIKKQIYVCNVSEEDILEDNEYVKLVKEKASNESLDTVKICGKIESEISGLDSEEEKQEFLADMGIKESGLNALIYKCYEILGLKTFFTAGEKEVRAWTFPEGAKAPQAAGIIHTDFERGFIKAEVFHCDELFTHKTPQKLKELGKVRIEGKEYLMKDGDIVHFRFNV